MADTVASHNVHGGSVVIQKNKGGSAISPMSYDGFQQRFKSYLVKDWSHMPLELSPIACSKNGWILESAEQIRCDFCNRTINVVLPKKNYEFYKRITKELEEKLISGHRTGCVWKSGLVFPEYFITNETEVEGKLEDHLLPNSKEISQHIDAFTDIKSLLKVQCIEDSAADLTLYAEHHDVHITSLTVAAHGWHIKSLGKDKFLHCEICCRKLSLWNKTDKDVDLSKHLVWCPWIQSSTSASIPVVNRMCTYVSQQLNRKRKRESLDYETSYQRKEELKEIVKYMRTSLS